MGHDSVHHSAYESRCMQAHIFSMLQQLVIMEFLVKYIVFLVNVLLVNYRTSNSNLGNCISGQMSFWANVLLGKRLLGKCLSGQMSFCADVFLGKSRLGKCLSGQISFWANVIWANVTEPIQLQLSLVNFCFALCGFLTMRKYKDKRIILINGQFGTI
jgi:ligand-binding sensor protein